MSGGCASTGLHLFTVTGSGADSAQLITGRARIMAIKVSNNGTTKNVLTFYDGTSNSDTKIHRCFVGQIEQNLDFEFFGAIVANGVFVEVTGSGTKANVSCSVQYS